jgi:cob(I)alamin adenosyltransferase
VRQLGSGFIWKKESLDEDRELAQKGWSQAEEELSSGRWDMVVLDELCIVLSYGLLDENRVLEVLKKRPPALTVIITGRNASAAMVDAADLVTEMKEVKHPYHEGVKARKGIEF